MIAVLNCSPGAISHESDILGIMTPARSDKVRPGNRRVTGKEQFYTPVELALKLTTQISPIVGGLQGKLVIEPAGGTGAFVKAAKELGATRVL
ncbi:MAG: hypothetical protein RLZZ606_778, partial [Actinomycetota bacterium]